MAEIMARILSEDPASSSFQAVHSASARSFDEGQVGQIALQQTTEVPLTDDNHVVQTFTPNRPDQPLYERVLPWTPGRGHDFGYSEHLDARPKIATIDWVTISDQITLRVPLRERFDDLLWRPFGGRMFGDPEVKDPPPFVLDDKKDEQDPQTNRWHGEEINRNNVTDVILEECLPALRWRPFDSPQDAWHGPLRDFDPEFLQFAMNARCTPQGICLCQGPN
jgi:hypothetical protein